MGAIQVPDRSGFASVVVPSAAFLFCRFDRGSATVRPTVGGASQMRSEKTGMGKETETTQAASAGSRRLAPAPAAACIVVATT